MANSHARKRRKRRTNWKVAFWMLILGIVIGTVLGIWLCANYDVLDVVGQKENEMKFDADQQDIETYPPVITIPLTTEEPEETVEPTIVPEPTPVLILPTDEPEEPTPVPVEPTPAPVEQDEGGFGLSSGFEEGSDESADDTLDPVMTDESSNAFAKEQYETVQGDETQTEEAVEENVSAGQNGTGYAVLTEPRPRTDPVLPGEWFVFETEISAEGMPYYGKDGGGFVVPLAMRVTDYMSPDDYAAQYGDVYQLYGVESAIAIEIRNDSASVAIVPENALGVVLRDKTDILNDSYPLADAPMKASNDITIAPGETVTVYKRYALNAVEGPYPFLSVAYMSGGNTYRCYFLLDGME